MKPTEADRENWKDRFRKLLTRDNDTHAAKNSHLLPERSWHGDGCYVDRVEAFIEKLLANCREEIQEDYFRRIEFCGFGAMEWRLKLIEKLKVPPKLEGR